MTLYSPYKGLMSYDRHDKENFFGRDQEKEILLSRILTHKVTLLYAATGVGKSSLLGAAVIPALEDPNKENLDVAYHRSWIDNPIRTLQTTVKQTLCRRSKITEVELHQLDDCSLPEFFDQCTVYSSDPLVLILDQFEEFFRYHDRQPDFFPFINQLAEIMTNQKLPVTIVFSMREDFLAELSVFCGRAQVMLSNSYRLQKLTWGQAREAIVKPVEQDAFGFQYEEALLNVLLRDLAGSERDWDEVERSNRPPHTANTIEVAYLQIVCQELWCREQHNPEKVIRQATYDALGGAQTIVKGYFEQIMDALAPAERRLASRAFAFLVTEWDAKMAYPEKVLAGLLKVKLPTLHSVLEKLQVARILRNQQRPEGMWYELYHDVFAKIIKEWRNAFRKRQQQRFKTGMVVLVLTILCMLGIMSYQGYQLAQHKARLAQNAGLLQVRHGTGVTLKLTCIRHYDPKRSCPEEPISIKEASVKLPGPADYMIAAYTEDWIMNYPIYINGVTHEIVLEVETPPKQIPTDMVYIPGGVFRMGDKDVQDVKGLMNERPAHDVEVSGFYMDAYEITNARYQACVQAGACTSPHYKQGACYDPTGVEIDHAFREATKPVVCVDWRQAKSFCEYAGKRLPTEAEWEKAAVGPEGYVWSFGNVFDQTKANTAESGRGATMPIGTHPSNRYGLYDMSGNASEWVEDWYHAAFYATPEASRKNPVNSRNGGNRRVHRGGSWWHGIEGVRTTRRHWDQSDKASTLVGFRCVKSYKPTPQP